MLLLLGAVFIYGLLLGASLASFACVVAERVPAGVSLMGRSQCACGRQLKWSENVPLLGWVKARGVAPCCGSRIPARYVWAELVVGLAGSTAAVGIVCALVYGPAGFVALGAAVIVAAPAVAVVVLWDSRDTDLNA